MKSFAIIAASLGLATIALPGAADAQRRQGIEQRQDNLFGRIDRGVRTGALTRREADRLRAEFAQVRRLESRYRAGGLSRWERQDLDRRYDALSARVRYERNDRQNRRY